MGKKIIILNGSPRSGGNTSALTVLAAGAAERIRSIPALSTMTWKRSIRSIKRQM